MLHPVLRAATPPGLVLLLVLALPATEPSHSPLEVARQIDAIIEKRLEVEGLQPAPLATDAEFLRRASLDLAGQVPPASRVREFLADESPDRDSRAIEALLTSDDFGRRLGGVWRDWIAPAELPSEGNGGNQPIQATRNLGEWFAQQFNADRPWDEIVREVVQVDGTLKESPQGLFYSLTGTDTGIPEPAGATRAVTSLFLGLDLQCAQCHDDPYRPWSQDEFWGQAAFFKNLEARFNGRYFDSVTESIGKKSEKGARKFAASDRSANGLITIPKDSFENAGKVVSGRFLRGMPLEAKPDEALRPLLSSWLTARENPYFARAFVNRTWSLLFSRGLVNPIDDMRPENPATHPEVLELLTAEFLGSGFDVKHLVRCIVHTRAYRRSSVVSKTRPGELEELNGRFPVRLMSTDQLHESLKRALDDPKLDLRTYDPNQIRKFGESSPVGDPHTEFSRLFETDENDSTRFTHGIPQFLALINHPRIASGGPRVARLVKEEVPDDEAVRHLYESTLSRPPTTIELEEALEFLREEPDRPGGLAGVLWMLVNRSEFLLIR